MTEQFKKYLKTYIALLVDEKTEFFIAIVDVERDLASDFLKNSEDTSYKTVWFERRDYAKAVRLRNNPDVRRIVLLSNDTVKMIDSLKDFVEYPILPERREDLWRCLEVAFEVELDSECRKILGAVLEQKQIPLEDLLAYIDHCMKNGACSAEEMLKNLYRFEIWSIRLLKKGEKYPSKGLLRRMIRNSNPIQIDKRLIGGLTGENPAFDETEQKIILECLSQNNLQELFRRIPYSEKIERLFKSDGRDSGTVVVKEKQEAQKYGNSYQYAISESVGGDLKGIEEELMAERNDSSEENSEENNPLEKSRQSFRYPDMELLKKELGDRAEEIKSLNFTERKRALVEEGWARLEEDFQEAMENGKEYTPAYLEHYVESQKKLIKSYLGFLALCLSDDGISRRCEGTGFLGRVQTLFCQRKGNVIKMPFYHPLMGFYYWKLQKSYTEYRNMQRTYSDDFGQDIILALSEKEQMDFPVQYMLWQNQLYQLDVTGLREWGTETEFHKVADYAVGSWTNIRLLNEDLMDYIARQRFLSEIRVTVIDLNDISEIMSMLEKLQRLPDSESCMVHKVILNIISEKEEALKEKLQESMEMDIDNPQVLFRFTRECYKREDGYDLEGIIRDSDLLFLADSSFLYQKPRLAAWEGDSNWFRIVMEQAGAEKTAETFLNQNEDLLEVLWDSIHYIELEEETKLACWRTRELRLPVFHEFQRAIEANPQLTIVLMSSNLQILQHVYHIEGFQARKSIVPGQEMLFLNFHKGSRRKELNRRKDARVRMFLKPFLEEFLYDSEILNTENEKEWERENPYFVFTYENCRLQILFEANKGTEDSDLADCMEYYGDLLKDMIGFVSESRRFKEKLITMLYEEVDSYAAALLVDYMERIDIKQLKAVRVESRCLERKVERRSKNNKDIVNVLAFQNMLDFMRGRTVDEYTMRYFMEFYSKDMLEGCLEAEETMQILEQETKQKMQDLYRMMENTNV